MESIKILLADDHEVVRAGYRMLLDNNEDLEVIAEAGSGEEAYRLYIEQNPDVVVMDIWMPGIGGLEASRRILQRDRSARILVFSVNEDASFLMRALKEGVLGYITKRSASQVMVEAVRAVARGDPYIGQEMTSHVLKYQLGQSDNPFDRLTAREFEVVRLLLEGQSISEIAEMLNLSPKTVSQYFARIKEKLEVANSVQLTRLAVRHGLVHA
jgi:two-component system invasion response regulator UvrY